MTLLTHPSSCSLEYTASKCAGLNVRGLVALQEFRANLQRIVDGRKDRGASKSNDRINDEVLRWWLRLSTQHCDAAGCD
jgi:hypothetical protein